jgi:hypothetical protein
MTTPRWVRAVTTVGIALLAACGKDSSGPATITDPQATIIDLFAVDSAFNTDAFRALASVTGALPPLAPPAPLAHIAAALRLTLPPAGAARALTHGGLQPQVSALRALGSASPQDAVLPDSLLGVTFGYDPNAQAYVETQLPGAPSNGVRFLLYLTDTISGAPDTSQGIGTLDIIDNAPAVGTGLRFLLQGTGGAPTFLDYSLNFLPAQSAGTITASGFISNGLPGALERKFTFGTSVTQTNTSGGTDGDVDYHYDVNVPAVGVNLHFASTQDTLVDSSTLGIDFQFSRRREAIRVLGADSSTSNTENGLFQVTVNGNQYATLTLTNGAGTITDHNGAVVPINPNDQQYEDDVVGALILGLGYAVATLGEVLLLPALIVGFSLSLF